MLLAARRSPRTLTPPLTLPHCSVSSALGGQPARWRSHRAALMVVSTERDSS